jgi:hypothetical protein
MSEVLLLAVVPIAAMLAVGYVVCLMLQLVQDTLLGEGLRVVKELVASQNKDSSTGSDNSYCDLYNNENKVQVTQEPAVWLLVCLILWLSVNILN